MSEPEKTELKENVLKLLFNKMINNKKFINIIKTSLVDSEDYELSAKVRELELAFCPKSESDEELNSAREYMIYLSSVGISTNLKTSWLLKQMSKIDMETFNLKDSSKLKAEGDRLFD